MNDHALVNTIRRRIAWAPAAAEPAPCDHLCTDCDEGCVHDGVHHIHLCEVHR